MLKSTLLDDGGKRHRGTGSDIDLFVGDTMIPPNPENVPQARAIVGMKSKQSGTKPHIHRGEQGLHRYLGCVSSF